MKLLCDLCGNILTEIDEDHAICNHCGLEYGPDRLQELRGAMPPSNPEPPASKQTSADQKTNQQQKSGCGTWFWIIVGILDLVVGTHGIVAVFCLIIALIVARSSKKK